MKTAIVILSAALIVALVWIYIAWNHAKLMEDYRMAQNLTFQDAIQRSNARVAVLDSAHKADRVLDSLRIANLSGAANREKQANKSLTKEIAVLRTQIQPQVDTLPEIRHFIALQDSSLRQKDGIIDTLEAKSAAQAEAMAREKDYGQSVRAELTGKADTLQLQSDNFQRMYLKADKQASKRWSVGPVGAYGVGNSGLTPFVGVGVTYSLFKF